MEHGQKIFYIILYYVLALLVHQERLNPHFVVEIITLVRFSEELGDM